MEEEIIYFYNVKDGKYYQSRYTHRWLNNLQQQCKKQKEVIDKAIEYISSQMIAYDDGEDCGVDCECDGFKLLDILKEVE